MVLRFTIEQVANRRSNDEEIKIIKQWLPKEKLPPLTSEQIFLFLKKADGDVDKAKAAIQICYDCKINLPQVFNTRKLEDHFHNIIKICAMPLKTDDGCAIIYISLLDTYYKRFSLDDYFKAVFMALEAEIYHEPINGIILLIDMEGTGLMHCTRLKLGTLKSSLLYMQHGTPVTIAAIHVLNTVSFIGRIMAILKPFMDHTFLRKVTFHHKSMKLEDFHKNHIAKHCLPIELGGLLPSTEELQKEYIKKLESLQDYFLNEEKQRCGGTYNL